MKKNRLRFLIIIFLFLSPFFVYSAEEMSPIKVNVRVDRSEVNIGDRIKYEIEIDGRKDIEVEVPGLGEGLKDLDIVDFGKKENRYLFNKKINYWYILENYNTGSFVIPSVTVKYRKKGEDKWSAVETDQIEIEVESLLASEDNDIKNIKDPVAPKSKALYIFLLLVVLAAGILLFLYMRPFFKKEKETVFKEAAHVIALRKLNILKNEDLPRQGKTEQYYVRLSGIVRYYIEERFNIRAPEMTTEEFLYNLKAKLELNPRQREVLREFLTVTDKVKFARFMPVDKEVKESFQIAYKFVEETKE
ncbi:MAG: hypothetical protein JSV34_03105 [Candidatus Omnitrophota bacterium]|nr:MAG: hypothetical protein JSV34_03105 [Candidatus Omnitrophota bacterium]